MSACSSRRASPSGLLAGQNSRPAPLPPRFPRNCGACGELRECSRSRTRSAWRKPGMSTACHSSSTCVRPSIERWPTRCGAERIRLLCRSSERYRDLRRSQAQDDARNCAADQPISCPSDVQDRTRGRIELAAGTRVRRGSPLDHEFIVRIVPPTERRCWRAPRALRGHRRGHHPHVARDPSRSECA